MTPLARNHHTRLATAILNKYTARSVARWIAENTKIGGRPYSYKNHEYQERILSDDSRITNTQKCSQVGLSEANARKALAIINILSPYTLAYTLPTAKFSATFAQTRIQPIIDGSDYLKDAIHKTTDNNEVKRFGDSFLFLKGAASSNAPISIPCDHLVHDEVDFSDQEVLGQYLSRLTHSEWQRIDRISTPTLPDYGVNRHFKNSRRNYNLVKCNHCNHYFAPDYYKHVKIPGYNKDLREITKQTLIKIRYKEAAVHCPNCFKIPSLQHEHREWVCENPSESHIEVGYQVTPFDAPNIVTAVQLIERSTEYERIQDFVNFALGLPMEDKEATLTREDFAGRFVHGMRTGGMNVMGIDVGNMYHFVVGTVDAYGDIHLVHLERVPMGKAKERYRALRRQFRVVTTVIDSGPHAETVMALQAEDPTCYAAVYTKVVGLVTHKVLDKQGQEEEGQEFVRQVNVNRNRSLDGYMQFIRDGHLTGTVCEEMDTFIDHHTSMKRARIFDNESGEMSYSWQKTDGVDHFHHAGGYCYIAAKMRGIGRSLIPLPLGVAMKIKQKPSN